MNEILTDNNTDNKEPSNNLNDMHLNNTDSLNTPNPWLASLAPEFQSTPSLTKFKDIGALAQSYLEAEKSLNQRVAIPKDEAGDEEWHKFYSRLGLPEDKKYLNERIPEDEPYIAAYEDMFYQNGLSRKQGAKLLESMYKFSRELQKKQQDELEKEHESNNSWLHQTYGNEFDTKMTLMQSALSKFGSKELASLIKDTNYDPAIVDLLVRVGDTLKSDSLVTGDKITTANTAESALSEIKRLEADKEFMIKFNDKNHITHESAVKKLEELYNMAYNKSELV